MAWATILSVFTDRADVTFGVTVSGRPAELPGIEHDGRVVHQHRAAAGAAGCLLKLSVCNVLRCSVEAAALRDHSYLGHAELRAIAGVGEMFDTLLVYENFPPGGLVGGDQRFEANGATFVPAALESLSHFPVTIAAHLADDRLTVFVETLEGALGPMTPHSLGRRLLDTVQRLIALWDRPLRDVTILSADEAARTGGAGHPVDAGPVSSGVHTAFAAAARATPHAVAVSWDDGALSYAEVDAAADRLAAAPCATGEWRMETPVAVVASAWPGLRRRDAGDPQGRRRDRAARPGDAA